MMGWRSRLRGGAEWDAFSPWRRFLCYLSRPGVTKAIKRQFKKRDRKLERQRIRDELHG